MAINSYQDFREEISKNKQVPVSRVSVELAECLRANQSFKVVEINGVEHFVRSEATTTEEQ
jgi:hypothetical protein